MGQPVLISSIPTQGIGLAIVDVANMLSSLLNIAGFIYDPELETFQALELKRLPAHNRQQLKIDRLT